ncbi:MAG TPA: radical SAM protein [Phycisphaeraceae bacterium]
MKTLMINEIFYSIQGESTWAGLPCVFVRLMGCHLRCTYCDTEYAFHEGRRWTIQQIMDEVERVGSGCRLVEVTGGEPLLQPNVHELMTRLCDADKTVLLETSGACDISRCDARVIRIMDLKTPSSGESHRNLWSNLDHLAPRDEIKFVIGSRQDYEWARDVIRQHRLNHRVRAVILSPVHAVPAGRELPGSEGLSMRDLAQWMLEDHLPARMQTQLHKLIWDPATRGV